MQLDALIEGFALSVATGGANLGGIEIERVTVDSRRAGPGVVFVAAPGATARSRDGHDFLQAAVDAGSPAVVVLEGREASIPDGVVGLLSADPRRAAAQMAERAAGAPSSRLSVLGVTGTNGKTTISFVCAQLLEALGEKAAVFGTLGVGRPAAPTATGYTTPEAEVLAEQLKNLADDGFTHVVMEVSSHALATRRADGVCFRAAAFTNLSQDHLDFHGSMEAYGEAKRRLFAELLPADACAVLPVDLPPALDAARWASLDAKIVRWGEGSGDVRADDVVCDAHGLRFSLVVDGQGYPVTSPLMGRHNLENVLVAAALAMELGHAPGAVAEALGKVAGAPGRFERVGDDAVAVIVDFAHSPGALERALSACRHVTDGRVLVVFGAGGDRDPAKRAPMGAIAAQLADGVWVTNDNPRSEAPEAIADAIVAGLGDLAPWNGERGFTLELVRERAIFAAVEAARDGDVVLLAGKGHEPYMIIGDQRLPFDDREVAARALAARRAA